MAISRQKKEELVDQYVEQLTASQAVVFTDYRGLSVHDMQGLRAKMRDHDTMVQVVKNTLLYLALERAGMPVPKEQLAGPTAIAYLPEDVSSGAKALFDFAKDYEALAIKGAILEGQVLDAEGAKGLRDLPSKVDVLSQLLRVIQTPASGLVRTVEAPVNELHRTIQAPLRDLALIIQAHSQQDAA